MNGDGSFKVALDVQLNVDESTGDLGGLAYRWFDELSQAICPRERQALAGLPSRVAQSKQLYGPLGEQGSVFGVVDVDRRYGRGSERNCSTAGMRWFRDQLADPPWRAGLWLGQLDERGHRSGNLLSLALRRDEQAPAWLQLSGNPTETHFVDPASGSATQQIWLKALFAFADQVNPGYGHIAYYHDDGRTALEYSFDPRQYPPQWRRPQLTMNENRSFLRGYSWLTIVPQELADRLGGVAALAACGAFNQVRQLSRGGVWLLATADYREFTEDALNAVFHALAPVLRPGTPSRRPQMLGKAPQRLIFEDASQVT
jgi:hypothetical protein